MTLYSMQDGHRPSGRKTSSRGAGVWEVGLGVGGWVGLGVGGFIGGQGRKKSSKFGFRVRWAPLNYGASEARHVCIHTLQITAHFN